VWPRPGRVLLAARSATFDQLAEAIDGAFARWDRNHLHEFTLADGTPVSPLRSWDGEEPEGMVDGSTARLGRLRLGEQFAYVFDLGDNCQHLCTVGPRLADPVEVLGVVPRRPVPCWGGRDPRPVRPRLGRRRRQRRGPARAGRAVGSPADPVLMGTPTRRPGVVPPAGQDGGAIRYRDLVP
jgi:hypothetical protein